MKLHENFFEILVLSRLDFQPLMVVFARHDCHGFTTLTTEDVMEKHNQTEELIDLGAATVETKGNQQPNLPDEVAGQFIKTSGIAQD